MKTWQRWTLTAMSAAALLFAAGAAQPENPEVQSWQTLAGSMDVPAPVATILAKACRNCHSDETVWPWYSRVAPMSWLVERDVLKARKAMNMSTWAVGPGRTAPIAAATLAAACADIRSGRMPLPAYRMMHPESRLSDGEKSVFCEWANSASQTLLSDARRGR